MEKFFQWKRWLCGSLVFLLTFFSLTGVQGATVIDHTCTDLNQIPEEYVEAARDSLHIAYQHTSHGSQLISGMNALQSYPPYGSRYGWSDSGETGFLDLDDYGIPGPEPDLSQGDYIDGNGVTPWVTATRNLLDNPDNSHVNVIMWSWCSINMHNAQRYVDNMEILISEYPDVDFIFMTGHAQGQGENLYDDPQDNGDGHVHYNNQLIRQHCIDHNRILFDFADIEAYDPDGNYYWDLAMQDNLDYESDGNWGRNGLPPIRHRNWLYWPRETAAHTTDAVRARIQHRLKRPPLTAC